METEKLVKSAEDTTVRLDTLRQDNHQLQAQVLQLTKVLVM